jgi:hypothetical protein
LHREETRLKSIIQAVVGLMTVTSQYYIVLAMQPNIRLAFKYATVLWSAAFELLVKVTSKSFSLSTSLDMRTIHKVLTLQVFTSIVYHIALLYI